MGLVPSAEAKPLSDNRVQGFPFRTARGCVSMSRSEIASNVASSARKNIEKFNPYLLTPPMLTGSVVRYREGVASNGRRGIAGGDEEPDRRGPAQ